MPKRYFPALVIVFMLILLSACSGLPGQAVQPTPEATPVAVNSDSVSASAKVVAAKFASLSFVLGGQEFKLNVKAGDNVQDGDVLAALAEDALPQSIIAAQADLIGAQRALDDLLKSESARYRAEQAMVQAEKALEDAQKDFESMNFPRASDDLLDKTQAEIDLARKQLALTEDAYKMVRKRPEGDSLKAERQLALTNARLRLNDLIAKFNWYIGKPDPLDYAESQAALALAKATLADAKREYERLSAGPDPNDVNAAKARVQALQTAINQKNLLAPFDGTIVEIYGNSGESISPGVPLILLADLSTILIQTTDLTEVDVARIKLGDPVKVTFDALPDTVIPGTVAEIALKNAAGSGVYYTVTVVLDETPEQLRWGMSAFVEIKVSK
ncbi:MAG: HlyD family efflux transporter periplasmic adaptor subunit [Chloroflexi bacterium]|nr:MAG: HlyD family efflux transporter periplasmic adaptor subunit [Chloroflexota bacterium]